MGGAHGTKQRLMEAAKYRPKRRAERQTREPEGWAGQQTYKRKGDVILAPDGSKVEVKSDGWH